MISSAHGPHTHKCPQVPDCPRRSTDLGAAQHMQHSGDVSSRLRSCATASSQASSLHSEPLQLLTQPARRQGHSWYPHAEQGAPWQGASSQQQASQGPASRAPGPCGAKGAGSARPLLAPPPACVQQAWPAAARWRASPAAARSSACTSGIAAEDQRIGKSKPVSCECAASHISMPLIASSSWHKQVLQVDSPGRWWRAVRRQRGWRHRRLWPRRRRQVEGQPLACRGLRCRGCWLAGRS